MGGPAEAHRSLAQSRVAVTGGAGFVGGRLVSALADLGAKVVVVDDLSTGDADLIGALVDEHPGDVRFVHASILDARALDDAFERCSIVFHLAAVSSVAESIRKPERAWDVNARGTLEVCQAAQVAGARRIVLASSAAVYGDGAPGPVREDGALRPMSPYAAAKLAAEHLVSAWSHSYGLDGVSLRLFNVYGPGQRSDVEEPAVVTAMLTRAVAGKAPIIFGDGGQTRDLVHVDDVVRAMMLGAALGEPAAGRAVNLATGRSTDLRRLAALIAETAGRPGLAPEFAPARPAEVRDSRADISLAARLLGWSPEITLEAGLRALAAELAGDGSPGASRASAGA